MGFLAALLSAFSAAAKDIVSKSVSQRVDPDVSTFASFFFAIPYYLVLLALAWITGFESFQVSRYFLMVVLMRGTTDVVAEGCKMRALKHGDVSLVSSFLSLSPIVLAFVSPFITGDIVSGRAFFALVIIVGGSLLLVQRDPLTKHIYQWRGIVYAMCASVAMAVNGCFDRLAALEQGALVSSFAMTAVAGILTFPMALRRHGSKSQLFAEARPFLLRGFFETVFMTSKLWALTVFPTHIVIGLVRLSLPLSVMAGWIFFGEKRTRQRLGAAILIYAGILILVWQ